MVVYIRTKCRFDNTDFCCGCIKTGECAPVIDDKPSADYVGSSINSPSLKESKESLLDTVIRWKKRKSRTTKGTCNRLDSSS